MKLKIWPAVLAMGLMALTSVLGWWAQPRIKMADLHPRPSLSTAFPEQIGEWKLDRATLNVPLPPDVAAQVQSIYTEVVDRAYVNKSGQRMMLTIAYGRDQSDGFKVHRPEVCYAAQGFVVGSPQDAFVTFNGHSIPVKRVESYKDSRTEPVTYWMVIGTAPVSTATEHKYHQIKYALHGLIADGLLVRVSSLSPNTPQSFEQQAQFIGQWQALVPAEQHIRIFGK